MDENTVHILNDLSKKLSVLISLMANPIDPASKPSLRQQIARLDQCGLKPVQIASILNKTPNHISKELTLIRREK